MAQTTFIPKNAENIQKLVGVNDRNLSILGEGYDATIVDTGNQIVIEGNDDSIKKTLAVLKALDNIVSTNINISANNVVKSFQNSQRLFNTIVIAFNHDLISGINNCCIVSFAQYA